MKRLFLILIALAATMSINAQIVKLYKNGELKYTYSTSEVDEVVFEEVPPVQTTGTTKATIGGSEVDVNWVQLWKDGPKFAEYNVGVTDGKAESYGGYYTWGGSINKDPNPVSKNIDSKLTGDNDTATKLWGNNWRMPTSVEFLQLKNNCICTWTSKNGVNGLLCTGKYDEYTSNSIFLPAAGSYYHNLDVFEEGGSGYYWSSTPFQKYTECFDFYTGVEDNYFYQLSSYHSDTDAYSVRAVLNENK